MAMRYTKYHGHEPFLCLNWALVFSVPCVFSPRNRRPWSAASPNAAGAPAVIGLRVLAAGALRGHAPAEVPGASHCPLHRNGMRSPSSRGHGPTRVRTPNFKRKPWSRFARVPARPSGPGDRSVFTQYILLCAAQIFALFWHGVLSFCFSAMPLQTPMFPIFFDLSRRSRGQTCNDVLHESDETLSESLYTTLVVNGTLNKTLSQTLHKTLHRPGKRWLTLPVTAPNPKLPHVRAWSDTTPM